MTNIFILYSTDAHHTISSRYFHGAFSSHQRALDAAVKICKGDWEYGGELTKEQLRQMSLINQTQGRDTNFEISFCEVDKVQL